MSEPVALTAAVERGLTVGALLAARLAPMTLTAPYLGRFGAAAVAGVVGTLALTLALWPVALATAPATPPQRLQLGVQLLAEAVRGIVLALSLLGPLIAMRLAGQLAAGLLQADPAAAPGQEAGADARPLATLYAFIAALLLVATDAHLLVVERLARGLLTHPVGSADGVLPALPQALAWMGDALALSLTLAAPLWVAALATELGLGLLSRLRTGPRLGLRWSLRRLVLIGVALLGLPMLLGRVSTLWLS